MFFRNGDPLDDFNRLDILQAQREARLPVCDKCKNPINEDEFYDDGEETLCEDCLKEKYGRSTEDYLNDNY